MAASKSWFLSVLICTLAALSTTQAALLRERPPHNFFTGSSSFSSFERAAGGVCLNGGSSVPSLSTSEHMFCLCAEGFQGKRCEIVINLDCYEGVGLYYRGRASHTQSGQTCVQWDRETRDLHMTTDIRAGRHNYCRNLNYRQRPWCNVMKDKTLVKEYCDIQRCGFESFTAQPELSASPEPEEAVESTCGLRSRKQHKIVGGTVSTVDAHPWVAAIFHRSKSQEKVFRCGGSLISACWVLTAAHCFPDGSQSKARRFSVVLGKNALNETEPTLEQNFRVEEIILHAEFDNSEGNFNNDIALVKLRAKQGQCAEESRSVRPVCLPPPHQNLHPGFSCEIAGYGKENFGLWYRSQYLREAHVNLISDDVCGQKEYYGNLITENMFCAGRPDWTQDACEGDSGGPLVCEVGDRLFQFGVVSWGDGCAKEFRPGVYTKLTNYNQWIEEKTGLSTIAHGAMFPQK